MGQTEAFELDIASARAVEQPDAVAKKDRRDAHEDLVMHASSRHCEAMLAPRMLTYLSPAAALASATPLSRSPTKVTPGTGLSDAW
jgi:hypothetical protein